MQDILDDGVERERLQGHLAALEHRAQSPNDLACAAVRRHDVRKNGLNLGHLRRFLSKQFLRGLGKQIVSSANLVSAFEAVLTEEQRTSHAVAQRAIDAILAEQAQTGAATTTTQQ